MYFSKFSEYFSKFWVFSEFCDYFSNSIFPHFKYFSRFLQSKLSEDLFLGLTGIFLYFFELFEDFSKIFQNPNLWSILSIFPGLARKKGGNRVPGFPRFFDYAYGVVSWPLVVVFLATTCPNLHSFAQRMGVKNVSFYWACVLLRAKLNLLAFLTFP